MGAHFRRVVLALCASLGLLAFQPTTADAHPQLCGKWIAPLPSGGLQVFEFQTGEYWGNGLWRGSFVFAVSGCPVASGRYELRMFTGDQGTLSLRSTLKSVGSNVGDVDFGDSKRIATVVFMNVTFRR